MKYAQSYLLSGFSPKTIITEDLRRKKKLIRGGLNKT